MSPEDVMKAEGWTEDDYRQYLDALYEMASIPLTMIEE